uniref:Uncharacterized protein n=1 Tax=Rhizophora mucronata TaxID=61149 RepID=A0A2P2NIR5_RHIMU
MNSKPTKLEKQVTGFSYNLSLDNGRSWSHFNHCLFLSLSIKYDLNTQVCTILYTYTYKHM